MKIAKWIQMVAVGMMCASMAGAGSLDPTNAPGPTMHTLEDIYQKLLSNEQLLLSLGAVSPTAGMVLIPAGTNAGTDPDLGAYSLTVTPFYMDTHEVTKGFWDEVKTWSDSRGYTYDNAGLGKARNHPVHTVSWYDVVKWCNARSEKAGLTPVYYTDAGYTSVYKTNQVVEPYVDASADGYRLPTDVEWEYAARGGAVSKRFPWNDSDNISHARANYRALGGEAYDDSHPADYHPAYNDLIGPLTSPVGAFAANGYGLYDMAGNVWEWCFDWHPSFVDTERVVRGGGWGFRASFCRVSHPHNGIPANGGWSFGVRAILPPAQQ